MTFQEIRAQEREDLKSLMESGFGSRFVAKLLDDTGCYGVPFTADPQATAYNCGRLAVGQQLRAELQALAPELLAKAERAHIERTERAKNGNE